jgi:hypothetical protein
MVNGIFTNDTDDGQFNLNREIELITYSHLRSTTSSTSTTSTFLLILLFTPTLTSQELPRNTASSSVITLPSSLEFLNIVSLPLVDLA